MRILVLTQAVDSAAAPDERDVLAQAALVSGALRRLGHEVTRGEVTLDLRALRRRLAADPPDLVFNLVESLDGEDELIALVPGLLEALDVPFTGSGAAALALTGDKPRAKARLRARGLPTPPWFGRGAPAEPFAPGRYLVKPARRHASQGIDARSLVEAASPAALDAAVAARARELGADCFAERYVDGREVSATLLARDGALALIGIAEIEFVDFPADRPRIVDYAAKWEVGSFAYEHTPRRFWSPTREGPLYERVARLARQCASALGVAGFARVDFRVDTAGNPWVLEVNANPCLSPDAGFLAAAAEGGLDPDAVCAALVAAARATPPPATAAPSPPASSRSAPAPEAPIVLDDTLALERRAELRSLVERTGFFTAAEIDVAVELLDEFWAKGADASGYRFVAAYLGARLAGYACFGPIPCSDTSHELYWIAVDPALQGRGLGRRLLERVVERVREEGGRQLYLDTSARATYAPTRGFYLGSGFRIAATLEDFYRPGDGKTIFVREV